MRSRASLCLRLQRPIQADLRPAQRPEDEQREPPVRCSAKFTLVITTSLQTAMMAGSWRLANAARSAASSPTRAGLLVGLASAIGSAGWFTACARQIAAHVRTLRLVELDFTLRGSLYAFRERPGRFEVMGSGS